MKFGLPVPVFLFAAVFSQTVLFQTSHGAKILVPVFMSSKSHKITYNLLLEELAARGHEITVLSPLKQTKNVTNIREIFTVDMEALFDSLPNLFEMKEKKESLNPFMMVDMFADLCKRSYELPQVQALLNEKFDLIINQPFMNECVAGFMHKFNTSMILITPVSTPGINARLMGSPSPVSFVPNLFTSYMEEMNFWQRTMNLIMEVFMTNIQNLYFIPKMEAVYREGLGDPTIPGYQEIMRNVSLILSNSHFSMGGRRPFLPDIIEVGGMHCRPAKPLPKDLEDFAQSTGKDGFIYFSMGSALKGSTMPDRYRKVLLSAFSKLKQKVLWKWETEVMEDLPANVKLIKWAPQQDILGHPKLRAFITHGGLGSTTEAVYHGVPLIGIPMFGDQLLNMQKSVSSGFAYTLELTELTEDKILTAINTVLGDPKYKENVEKLSKVFRDQPSKALDRAVFWTEYVLRHKGAPHLRSAARDLNFFQYHSLDVIGALLGGILFTLYLVYATLKFIVRKVCGLGGSKNGSVKPSKKRN